MKDGKETKVAWALALLLCAFGLFRAFSLRWATDDAFICFRYAAQAIRGHGLVFNPGERVEGYTNFLWTILLTAGMKLGLDPIPWSEALGVLCYGALLGLFLAFSRRLASEGARGGDDTRKGEGEAPFLPIAAACLASIWSLHSFATSGLETMFFTLLGAAGLVALVFASRPRDHAIAGVLFSLSMMTRVDGALFYAAGFAGVLWEARTDRQWRPLVALLLPALLIVIPFFGWRLAYYGDLLPNTYYAKSGGLSNWPQGLHYERVFFRAYLPLLAAAPALALALWAGSRLRREGAPAWLGAPGLPARRAAIFAAVICALELLYVARVGGDFMFARFLVPVTPFLCVALELGVRQLRPAKLRWALAAALPAALLVESLLYPRGPMRFGEGIGEERAVYPASSIEEAKAKGAILKRYLGDTSAQVIFYGSQAMLAYYADFPVAIEGYGLTDSYLAHLPLKKRGRPGHEKQAPMDYLWRRGVNFVFASGLMKMPPGSDYKKIDLGGVEGQILVYDRALMEKLGRMEGAKFVRFEEYLDDYARQIPSKPKDQVRADFVAFQRYYFDKNPDPQRESAFADYR